ncbi:MAG: T9SS type A sorting domain-containing protein [Bacteroidetes bacterium]|nr:T9SS type A sorting domain-containing protein [Bacteroidota bacterium]
MKKLFTLLFSLAGVGISIGQTTAMDFTKNDCATGQSHHLFAELDSGKAVIMEFFMNNCPACIDGGNALEPLYQKLKQKGCKVLFYQTSFNNTYKCSTITLWQSTNGFSGVPFDSGAAQITYYGGFGMPTVVVAAGSSHQILYLTNAGFPAGDTAKIDSAISAFCATAATNFLNEKFFFSVFPKPALENFTLSCKIPEPGNLKIEMETILGEKVKMFVEEKIQSGEWERNFSAVGFAKGIYFLRIYFNDKSFAEKIIIE